MSKSVLPMFSSRSFIVSSFTLRCLIHFNTTFVCGIRECYSFILYMQLSLCCIFCLHCPRLMSIGTWVNATLSYLNSLNIFTNAASVWFTPTPNLFFFFQFISGPIHRIEVDVETTSRIQHRMQF